METTKQQNDLLIKSKIFAIENHKNVNQKYGIDQEYSFHLNMVYLISEKFIFLLPLNLQIIALCSAWTHDLIEDARLTYNDIKEHLGIEIAEVTYDLTNEKGKNRKERASDKYYSDIRKNIVSNYVKICDRIANLEHSKNEKSRMFEVYKKENLNFKKQLYREEFKPMFDYIESLLN